MALLGMSSWHGMLSYHGACASVCPSIFETSRKFSLIGTGEAAFDALEQRKDDGADRREISTTQHVPRAAA